LNGIVDRANNRIQLSKIKDDLTYAYAEGKITEQHYNTALARQRQADASCAVAVTCPEGTTTVTSTPPTATCDFSNIGGQPTTPTDGTCTASLPAGATNREVDIFKLNCGEAGGVITGTPDTGLTCTFPSTPPT
jgi:hypothetical protein